MQSSTAKKRDGFADVALLLSEAYRAGERGNRDRPADTDESAAHATIGYVYLVMGHKGEYKIGRTNLVGRRLAELGTVASVEPQLIHEIKTDDPSGVEAYWHLRFADRRLRGEWFRLRPSDVRAFRRWRRIY